MAAKKKAAPKSKPTAKKAPKKTSKHKTSSAPGESAEAHKWLIETQGVTTPEPQQFSETGNNDAADVVGPTEITVAERDKVTGRFLPGNSGFGGRPKGSRNKLAEEFINDFYNDWLLNGADVIAQVRMEKPDVYFKGAVAILPKQVDMRVSEFSELTEETLDKRMAQLAQELGLAMAILTPGTPTAH